MRSFVCLTISYALLDVFLRFIEFLLPIVMVHCSESCHLELRDTSSSSRKSIVDSLFRLSVSQLERKSQFGKPQKSIKMVHTIRRADSLQGRVAVAEQVHKVRAGFEGCR